MIPFEHLGPPTPSEIVISYINGALSTYQIWFLWYFHIILVRSEDVEVRMEQGKLSIHIRVAEEEKKLLLTLLFEACNSMSDPLNSNQDWSNMGGFGTKS